MSKNLFNLKRNVTVITGGAGLLGYNFVKSIFENNGIPVVIDNDKKKIKEIKQDFYKIYKKDLDCYHVNITKKKNIKKNLNTLVKKYGKIHSLINNAARNPKYSNKITNSNFENYSINEWIKDCEIGLTGSLICSQIYGSSISKNKNGGTIINISSDLGLISPDQRIYQKSNKKKQFIKPVSYSIIKTGLIGLTRYLSTYWGNKNVRCNCICPGGIQNNHDSEFLKKITKLIPLGRMAQKNDYNGLIIFLLSDSSSYLNGSIISADGGRTSW